MTGETGVASIFLAQFETNYDPCTGWRIRVEVLSLSQTQQVTALMVIRRRCIAWVGMSAVWDKLRSLHGLAGLGGGAEFVSNSAGYGFDGDAPEVHRMGWYERSLGQTTLLHGLADQDGGAEFVSYSAGYGFDGDAPEAHCMGLSERSLGQTTLLQGLMNQDLYI